MVKVEEILPDWQVYILYAESSLLAGISGLFYLSLVILLLCNRTNWSIKKGMNLLMCITLFFMNVLYTFPIFLYVEQYKTNPDFTIPRSCVVYSAIRDNIKLLNVVHFSYIFLYSYMVMYHTNFIINHTVSFTCSILGVFWILGIINTIYDCIQVDVRMKNNGECESASSTVWIITTSLFLITVIINVFCIFKIHSKLKEYRESCQDVELVLEQKNRKKVYTLGLIQLVISLIAPWFFVSRFNFYVIFLRVFTELFRSFIFIIYYTFDDDIQQKFKELYCCKEKQKEEEVQRDSRVSDPDEYNELDENL